MISVFVQSEPHCANVWLATCPTHYVFVEFCDACSAFLCSQNRIVQCMVGDMPDALLFCRILRCMISVFVQSEPHCAMYWRHARRIAFLLNFAMHDQRFCAVRTALCNVWLATCPTHYFFVEFCDACSAFLCSQHRIVQCMPDALLFCRILRCMMCVFVQSEPHCAMYGWRHARRITFLLNFAMQDVRFCAVRTALCNVWLATCPTHYFFC